jgi:hypothetical protein
MKYKKLKDALKALENSGGRLWWDNEAKAYVIFR